MVITYLFFTQCVAFESNSYRMRPTENQLPLFKATIKSSRRIAKTDGHGILIRATRSPRGRSTSKIARHRFCYSIIPRTPLFSANAENLMKSCISLTGWNVKKSWFVFCIGQTWMEESIYLISGFLLPSYSPKHGTSEHHFIRLRLLFENEPSCSRWLIEFALIDKTEQFNDHDLEF